MDLERLRSVFDAQVRRNTTTRMPGVAGFLDSGDLVCELGIPGQRQSCVNWSGLDESRADGAIARQVDYFRRRGEPFEWQLLGYDQPADLGDRLVRASFVPDEEEVLLFAGTAGVPQDVPPPDGIRLVEVRDAAGVEAAAATQEDLLPGSPRRARHVSRMVAGLA